MVFDLPKVLKGINSPFVRNNDTIDRDTVMYKLFGFKIPEISVPSIKVPHGGYVAKVSSHTRPEYPAIEVTFTIDSGFQNYHVLHKWLHVLSGEMGKNYDPDNLSKCPGLGDYTTTITIFALNEYDKVIAEFVFTGSFVTKLAGIEYNYRQEKEIESSFSFEFTFMEMNLVEEPYSIHFNF